MKQVNCIVKVSFAHVAAGIQRHLIMYSFAKLIIPLNIEKWPKGNCETLSHRRASTSVIQGHCH